MNKEELKVLNDVRVKYDLYMDYKTFLEKPNKRSITYGVVDCGAKDLSKLIDKEDFEKINNLIVSCLDKKFKEVQEEFDSYIISKKF